ncbi:hypothetical protein [Pseudomonas sp. S1Bt23]|jgi:hypothetical protein|uniref:hypothetical protein n=1 Tax=Pseudomonas sp. S1Bt23 TaxID=3095074 RepID=UPI002A598AD2|nr:hypothetical protein [Pseudomonas sp. S1Bt23]WPO49547.1 hypothetical protein SHB59_10980 [Pseudomonas sp. S1Bt23]
MSIDTEMLMGTVEQTKDIVNGMSKDLQVDAGTVADTYNIMMNAAEKPNEYEFNELEVALEQQIISGRLNDSVSRHEGRIVKVVVY